MLNILHTSDLHLGKSLYSKSRTCEFEYILNTILDTIQKENIDILLIAGDIFDTTMPPNEAQKLYYSFIQRLSQTNLKHTVIIAGNHDSQSFLNAPKDLISYFRVSVVASIDKNNLDDEIIVIKDQDEKPLLIVCAIPYLKERDLREAMVAESEDIQNQSYKDAVSMHIKAVTDRAFVKRDNILKEQCIKLDVIAMCHLFTQGGVTVDNDGVRDLFVGTLSHIAPDVFDKRLSYVALGHLHVPQKIKDSPLIEYSGTPLAMGFSEKEQKHLCKICLDNSSVKREYIDIKAPKILHQIAGDLVFIKDKLNEYKALKTPCMVEIILKGHEDDLTIKDTIYKIIEKSEIELIRIKDMREVDVRLKADFAYQTLSSLDEMEVFDRLLKANHIDDEQSKQELTDTYLTIKKKMLESDK